MSFIVYLILCRNLTRRIVSALPSPYGDSLKAGNFDYLLLGLGEVRTELIILMLEKYLF